MHGAEDPDLEAPEVTRPMAVRLKWPLRCDGPTMRVTGLPARVLRDQRAGRLTREGPGEIVALAEVVPGFAQTGELLFGLDALGYRPGAHRMREAHLRR